MNSQDYYYNKFPDDLKEVLSKVTLGGDGHFHIVDLFTDRNDKIDCLKHIPKERNMRIIGSLNKKTKVGK